MKTTIKTITINQIFFTIQWRYHGYHPGGVCWWTPTFGPAENVAVEPGHKKIGFHIFFGGFHKVNIGEKTMVVASFFMLPSSVLLLLLQLLLVEGQLLGGWWCLVVHWCLVTCWATVIGCRNTGSLWSSFFLHNWNTTFLGSIFRTSRKFMDTYYIIYHTLTISYIIYCTNPPICPDFSIGYRIPKVG